MLGSFRQWDKNSTPTSPPPSDIPLQDNTLLYAPLLFRHTDDQLTVTWYICQMRAVIEEHYFIWQLFYVTFRMLAQSHRHARWNKSRNWQTISVRHSGSILCDTYANYCSIISQYYLINFTLPSFDSDATRTSKKSVLSAVFLFLSEALCPITLQEI
jgi:hypothetical protein